MYSDKARFLAVVLCILQYFDTSSLTAHGLAATFARAHLLPPDSRARSLVLTYAPIVSNHAHVFPLA